MKLDIGFCECTDDGDFLRLCRVHHALMVENGLGGCDECRTARLVEAWA